VTPLLRAAKAQDAPAIKLLLEHGAIVDLPNNDGTTPTLAASGIGSVDADTRGSYYLPDIEERAIASLELLLAHGGELNGRAAVRRDARTALRIPYALWRVNIIYVIGSRQNPGSTRPLLSLSRSPPASDSRDSGVSP